MDTGFTQDSGYGIAAACRIELAELSIKQKCCRRAFLGGVMLSAALEGDKVSFLLEEDEVVDIVLQLMAQVWPCESEAIPVRRGAHKRFQISFTSHKAAEWIRATREHGMLRDACPNCFIHFARGMFIGGGTLTDPEKGLHLEIMVRDPSSVVLAANMLSALGIEPKCANRVAGTGFYLKRGETIEEFLAAVGATKTVFAFINAKIVREIRGHENRVANCDAGNIGKSVAANAAQLEAIADLRRYGRIDRLDDEQRRTAELREAFPELSLSELGLRMSPPISKSGMYHRMNKIIAVAETVREEAAREGK